MLSNEEYKKAVEEAKEELKAELLAVKYNKHSTLLGVREKYIIKKNASGFRRGEEGELAKVIGLHSSWRVYEGVRAIIPKIMNIYSINSINNELVGKRANEIAEMLFAVVLELAKKERAIHDNEK